MNGWALFTAVFLACVVEAVEALTIILAAGTAHRQWRSALTGMAAALGVLAIIVAALGPALTAIPLRALRLVVGALLLIFGLQWLRKAILRGSGHKALHDEAEIFRTELAAARATSARSRGGVADWYAFTLSFKGVLLEGLEVAFVRRHLRQQCARGAVGRARRRLCGGSCRRAGDRRARAAGPRAGERHEVRRRRHAHGVRDVLGG